MTPPAALCTPVPEHSVAHMSRSRTSYQHRPSALALAAAALLLAAAPLCDAVTALSGWTQGIATNYGGPADGMSPYSPSFGTQDVRPPFLACRSACQTRPDLSVGQGKVVMSASWQAGHAAQCSMCMVALASP